MMKHTGWRCGGGTVVLHKRAVLSGAGALFLACAAFAQPQDPPEPPLDVNAIQPQPPSGAVQPAVPAAPTEGAAAADGESQAEAAVPAPPPPSAIAGSGSTGVIAMDGPAFPVSRFVIEFQSPSAEQPSIEDLAQVRVRLAVTPTGYVSPGLETADVPPIVLRRAGDLPEVELSIAEVAAGSAGAFHASALNAVTAAIALELNRRGFAGVFAEVNDEDIIAFEDTAEDLREGERSELRLRVWTPSVGQVRTQATGDRLAARIEADPSTRINNADPVHTRIREQSPLQQGNLLRKDLLDDFIFRLNRHPGRRVDAALGAGEKPEEVVLDYLVTESKPWSIYAQLSNTGTRQTSEWRQRFGFTHNQLTGHDDILRLDYITSGFDASHTFNAQYDFPIVSDRVRMLVNAIYSDFDASDVGSSGTFTGTTIGARSEVAANVYQHREFFLDAIAGARWANVEITQETSITTGEGDFIYPYIGARAERFTDASFLSAAVTLEVLWPEATGLEESDFQNLGRQNPSDESQVLKFNAEQSFYLEPLINSRGYSGESNDGLATLAHELSFAARGQYSFGDRLIANEQDVAGGLFTVRGYPESVIAADTVAVLTAEYRFHLPQALGVEWDGRSWNTHAPGTWYGRPQSMFDPNFRYTPQQPFGRADWDLIFRGFVDAAFTDTVDPEPGEVNETIWGTGIGVEFQWKRNVLMRLDWGVALSEVGDPDSASDAIRRDSVDKGDNRFHFLFTLLY